MLDIRTAPAPELPDDINALSAYWISADTEIRSANEYLFTIGAYDQFFSMLRLSLEASMAQNMLPEECKAEVRRELENPKKARNAKETKEDIEETIVVNNSVQSKGKNHGKREIIMSPYPTELTRCCPFVPIRLFKNIAARQYNNAVLADNSWGTITYTGPELTTSHEDVLLSVLALIAKGQGQRIIDAATGRDSYVYTGSRREIFKVRGNATPSALNYKALKQIMTDMSRVNITYHAKNKGNKKPSTAVNIDNLASYDERNDGSVTLRINSYFVLAYEQELVTWINLSDRVQVESLYGKAIHRFISSHKSGKWNGSIKIIAAALNIPVSPMFKVRDKIRRAISEMVVLGILTKESRVTPKDIVILVKSKRNTNT